MFPSLVIRASGLEPRGPFAEAQAAYLEPDDAETRALETALTKTQAGVVAHFYMDAELQGTLARVRHPFVHVADSLQMAERAVDMAAKGARAIVVLGVDFMSENVRATLDAAGHAHVPVYRVADRRIGCSLAESAEAPAYRAYLERASKTPRSLHVIYVNTSLGTKALAESLLPTITCTSSNVVQTVLEAFAAVPGAHVWFGPDTYMGHNLEARFRALVAAGTERIQRVHPGHTEASVQSLLERLHTFEEGVCVVHHMFGDRVAARIAEDYGDALLTAHFEVPSGMFDLALTAERAGRGVVGSTSNILSFIGAAAGEVARSPGGHRRVVLGTESGMVASIVREVQTRLRGTDGAVEIVFPVAAEAVTQTGEASLPIVPGPAAGEGCSVEGGCATCPFMKMNSLTALLALLERVEASDTAGLTPYLAATGGERAGAGSVTAAGAASEQHERGVRSIVRMREFQRTGHFPEEFLARIRAHGV